MFFLISIKIPQIQTYFAWYSDIVSRCPKLSAIKIIFKNLFLKTELQRTCLSQNHSSIFRERQQYLKYKQKSCQSSVFKRKT